MNPLPKRKRNRLQDYNYSQDGWYFVTICAQNREIFFGKIENDQTILNNAGKIVEQCWLDIPLHFPSVILDDFMVMPNHVHGILVIKSTYLRNTHARSLQCQKLSVIIGSFKSAASKYIHQCNGNCFQWQKSFYDHIIRNEISLNNIREYIRNNPIKWTMGKDRNHLHSPRNRRSPAPRDRNVSPLPYFL